MEEDTIWSLGIMEGIVAILFGIAAVFWPGLTLVTLLYLFAAFILVSGIVHLVHGIFRGGRASGSWFLHILLAVILIGIGVFLLRHPHVRFAVFVLLIGFSLIIRGVFDVVAAFIDDLSATTRTMYVITGILAAIVGIIILFQPVSGGVAFVWVLGLYALITGPVLIATALDYRRATRLASK